MKHERVPVATMCILQRVRTCGKVAQLNVDRWQSFALWRFLIFLCVYTSNAVGPTRRCATVFSVTLPLFKVRSSGIPLSMPTKSLLQAVYRSVAAGREIGLPKNPCLDKPNAPSVSQYVVARNLSLGTAVFHHDYLFVRVVPLLLPCSTKRNC